MPFKDMYRKLLGYCNVQFLGLGSKTAAAHFIILPEAVFLLSISLQVFHK